MQGQTSDRRASKTKLQISASKTSDLNFQHYEDSEYAKQLSKEVEQLRLLLDSDFKNQRIIDLENKIRDNKRNIVNLMTENIFNLRFDFSLNSKN